MAERPRRALAAAVLTLSALVSSACSSSSVQDASPTDSPSAADVASDDRFPDIVAATLAPRPDGSFDVSVTVSSPYDSPQRYADGWRVVTTDGDVLGTHELLHDHANEQPFTRLQTGLVIPDGVGEIVVEGRDSEYGFGGDTVVVIVPAPGG